MEAESSQNLDPPQTLPSREASRFAAERRALQTSFATPTKTAKEAKLELLKIIDDKIIARNDKARAIGTLTVLKTILTNASNGEKDKLSIRTSNAAISKHGPALVDYLVQAGFTTTVVNFEQRLNFSPTATAAQTERLTLALDVLSDRLTKWQTDYEASELRRKRAVEDEAARVGRTKKVIDDDRERVRVRTERERNAREAAAQAKGEEDAIPSPSTSA